MTIRHIQTFAAVYEHMNITHAANALHMTQPAVSRMIRELEAYYNISFFERINHRLRPTDAGKRLYEHASQIIERFRYMESDIRDINDSFTLNIGATYTLGSCILPSVIKRLKTLYPKAVVRGHIYNAGNLSSLLIKGQLDFAMIEDRSEDPALDSEVFFEDQMILILPPDHSLLEKDRLTMKDLEDQPVLLRDPGSFGRKRVDDAFSHRGLLVNPLLESCSTRAIIESVGLGLGVAFLPWYLVKDDLSCGKVASRSIEDESFFRYNYMVWQRDKVRSSSMLKAMDICRAVAGDLLSQELSKTD